MPNRGLSPAFRFRPTSNDFLQLRHSWHRLLAVQTSLMMLTLQAAVPSLARNAAECLPAGESHQLINSMTKESVCVRDSASHTDTCRYTQCACSLLGLWH